MNSQKESRPPQWSNFLLTFFGVTSPPSAYVSVQVRIETKALSLVFLDPAHQALIDRILELKDNGRNCRQIAEHLNDKGVQSWSGKRFYPSLVFGVIRKARLKDTKRNLQKISALSVQLVTY